MSNPILLIADPGWLLHCQRIFNGRYEVRLLDHPGDVADQSVLCWANGLDISEQAEEIAAVAQTVKLVSGRAPTEFTDWPTLKEWAVQNAQIIKDSDRVGDTERPPASTERIAWEPSSEPVSSAPELPRVDSLGGSSPSATDPDAGEPYWAEPPPDEEMLESRFRSSVFVLNPEEDNWPEPIDITTQIFVGMPFKLEMLPEALRAFVFDESQSKGTDPAITALAALGACAGVANDATKLQVFQNDPRWLVRPCIWPIIVGNPSSGKTPAIEACMTFAQKLDAELCRNNIQKLKDYDYAMKQFAEKERIAIKNGDPRPEEPEHPEIEQIWLDKTTMEGARDVLQYSKRGVLWYRDEWSGAIAELDRYSKKGGGSGDRQRFLKLFDGGLDKQNLANHRTIVLENWSAVVCGGIQPSAIIKYLGELENDGLLQRTLICMARPKKPGQDRKPDWQAMEQFKHILSVLRMAHGECVIKMSPEAAEVRQQFVDHIALRIKHEANLPLASHMGKWEGYCSRMMLLYHLIDLAAKGQQPGPNERISLETANQVISFFLDWELSHIQEFWIELMNDKQDRSFAQTVARYILANPGLEELSLRDHVARPHWSQWGPLKPWQRREAMNILVNMSWLVETGGRKSNDGISTTFKINPKIKTIFADQAAEEKIARQIKRQDIIQMRAQYKAMRAMPEE